MNFRVASFNLFNLVRPGVRYYDARPYSEAEHDAKVAWTAALIDTAAADIVGFQEVFSVSSLRLISERSQRLGVEAEVYAPGATQQDNEVQDQDGSRAVAPKVGLASRFPVSEITSITAFPAGSPMLLPDGFVDSVGLVDTDLVALPITQFQRPVLRAVVDIPDVGATVLLVAHLKSKRPLFLEGEDEDDPFLRAIASARAHIVRVAEAAALRHLVLQEIDGNDQPLVLLGDLNDGVPSVTTQLVAGDPPFRFLPRERKEAIWDTLLYSATDVTARSSLRDVAYTYIFNGRYDVLDHVLVSQEFYRANPDHVASVVNQRIYNDHLVDATLTDLPRDRVVSDHGIPVAEIDTDR